MKKGIIQLLLLPLLLGISVLSARADHPGPGEMDHVIECAQHVCEGADYAYALARRDSSHYDWRQRYALDHLRYFASDARHFMAQLNSWRHDPAHTESDFERLERSFDNACHTFYDLRPSYALTQAWDNVRSAMSELEWYYGDRGHDPGDPGNPGYSDVRIDVTRFEEGGNWDTVKLNLEGDIYGHASSGAIYLDGQLKQQLSINAFPSPSRFYAKLTWKRWSNNSRRLVEVKVVDQWGRLTVWSQWTE